MAKWFGAHYNQDVHFRSAVKCRNGPQVLTCLIKNKIIIIIIKIFVELWRMGGQFEGVCVAEGQNAQQRTLW